jgi:hypothetical protein
LRRGPLKPSQRRRWRRAKTRRRRRRGRVHELWLRSPCPGTVVLILFENRLGSFDVPLTEPNLILSSHCQTPRMAFRARIEVRCRARVRHQPESTPKHHPKPQPAQRVPSSMRPASYPFDSGVSLLHPTGYGRGWKFGQGCAVPYLHRAISARGREAPAAGTERYAINDSRVLSKRAHFLTRVHVPDLYLP